jgi:hypothetical protein
VAIAAQREAAITPPGVAVTAPRSEAPTAPADVAATAVSKPAALAATAVSKPAALAATAVSKPAELDAVARRVHEAGGPTDRASYACSCGYLFAAAVSTTVECPHCGTAQAW